MNIPCVPGDTHSQHASRVIMCLCVYLRKRNCTPNQLAVPSDGQSCMLVK
jgi:hypothetical protein